MGSLCTHCLILSFLQKFVLGFEHHQNQSGVAHGERGKMCECVDQKHEKNIMCGG